MKWWETHRLNGTKEASAKCRGRPCGSNSREASQWDDQEHVNTDEQVADTQELEIFFRWNKVVIIFPKGFPYLSEKNNEMFTDELIWGSGSAPQYRVEVGLAGV